ncbi:IS1 family transposase [Aeromonas encheleia]
MTTTKIPCRFCSKSGGVIRHGYSPNGFQRFRCLDYSMRRLGAPCNT